MSFQRPLRVYDADLQAPRGRQLTGVEDGDGGRSAPRPREVRRREPRASKLDRTEVPAADRGFALCRPEQGDDDCRMIGSGEIFDEADVHGHGIGLLKAARAAHETVADGKDANGKTTDSWWRR